MVLRLQSPTPGIRSGTFPPPPFPPSHCEFSDSKTKENIMPMLLRYLFLRIIEENVHSIAPHRLIIQLIYISFSHFFLPFISLIYFSHLFLNCFSHLFLSFISPIYFSIISHLFLIYFSFISHLFHCSKLNF